MKVMLLNGSPHEKGCTYTALEEIQRELKKCGVDSEILHVGQEEIHGCIGCRRCAQTGRCVFDDVVNRIGPGWTSSTALSSVRRCITRAFPAS